MLPESPSRRRFLESAAALPLAAATMTAAPRAGPARPRARLPGAMPKRAVADLDAAAAGPFADRFAAAKTAGFEAIEMQTHRAAEVEAAGARGGQRHAPSIPS